jgi:hypothetical protein
MKYLFLCAILFSLSATGQDKNIITVTRVFPKMDRQAEFEKAIAAHAQKYHTGDWFWKVAEIQSGPDAGGFQIMEGPHTWDQIDKRGTLGAEHTANWNKTVAIHLTDKYQSMFAEYKPEYSSVALTEFSDKYAVNHVYIKPGSYPTVLEVLAAMKKTWTHSNQSVAIYESSASGAPQIIVVTRYKKGLAERQTGAMKPLKERYEEANGAGTYQQYTLNMEKTIESSWSELLFNRTDLGSK